MANKRSRTLPILDQWVEVTVEDGRTLTELLPPNDILIAEGQAMDPPPELVYRRIHFCGAVPPEYAWTRPDDQAGQYGGACIQRMTVETWLETIAREAALDTGHIGPSAAPSLPRPNERGGCDCPYCSANQHLLEELGYSV